MNNFFKKITNYWIFMFIFIVFFLKILLYFLIKNNFLSANLGGGSDASYYHSYAIGMVDVAVNAWPPILRYFNEIGLYSREYFSFILFSLNLIIIPLLSVRISGLSFKYNQKLYLYLLLLCLIYPTLYFYTFDIYRDVFMVFLFLVGCLIFQKSLNSSHFLSFSFFYIFAILIGILLLNFRPYLGYAFIMALFLWKVRFTKNRIIVFIILYSLALFVANYVGFLDHLTEYRSGFEEGDAGSTMGLNFSNPVMFIPNFILSTLGQLFGLYITNPIAIALLLVETIPFIFMLFYIFKNINFADNFIRFLIVFFVLYASVWLIGNDNLGTAVRLRMYNYFAVYICFFYILRLKGKMENQQVINK